MNRPYIITIVLIAVCIVIMITGFNASKEDAAVPEKSMVFVVNDDTGAFFMQLKRGIWDAAQAYNAKCVVQVLAKGDAFLDDGYQGALLYVEKSERLLESMVLPSVVIGQKTAQAPYVICENAPDNKPVADAADMGSALVKQMEAGKLDSFWAQDPYALGYCAMRALCLGQAAYEVPLKLITQENMYLKENIKLIFPLLQ